MNSDNYEFAKSTSPQGVDLYSPYQEKSWNYVNDINSSVYSNNSGLTQVQWDLTSIYNSGQFCDATDLFLAVPIVTVGAFTDGTANLVAPVAGNSNLVTLKSNYQTLIHQIEIVNNGKVVNQTQPYVSQYTGFRMLSQMSVNDLKQWGSSLGFGEELDSEKATVYSPVVDQYTPQLGVGLCNNRPFVTATATGTDTQSFLGPSQNTGAINKSLQRRCTRIVDAQTTTANSFNKIYGTGGANGASIMSLTQLNSEFKPNYTVNGSIMTWYDVAIIPLKYLCDVVDKLGLVKKLDMILRIYFNTGSLRVSVSSGTNADNTLRYGAFSNSTFSNTCPLMVNHLPATSANGGIPAGVTGIVAGCFIARSPTTSITSGGATVNFGGASHPMASCRTYYSLVKLAPSQMEAYVLANREKQVVYEDIIFNQYNAIPSGGSFSQLVQSGIKNPLGVAIIPFIGSSTPTGAGGTVGFDQWQSPYDPTGGSACTSPISLTNLQVALGGVNQLNSTLYYTFENFLEQVGLAETLTSSDFGVGTGVISQSFWEMNRVYWVALDRGRDADRASMRNLTISFNNNSNAIINLFVFTVYLDRLVIDVETGIVRK